MALAGCGGGGGGTPATPPAPAAITIAGVSPADGATDVAADVTATGAFTATNAGTVSGNGTAACPASVAVTVTVTGSSFTAKPAGNLPDGATCSLTVNLAGSLGGSATKTISFITKPAVVAYKYARLNLVVFADQSGYLGVINDATGTVTPLVNKTGYTDGIEPIRLCGIYDKLLPEGNPLASCVTRFVGNTRRNFPINPLTGELMAEYTGVVPAGAVWHDVGYGAFDDTPYAAFGVNQKGMYIDVPSMGTYYVTSTDRVNLRLTKDGFATNKIIATCANIGCFQYLTTFSNP